MDLPAGFRLETDEERGVKPGPRIDNLPEGFRLETPEEAAPGSKGPIHDTLSSFNDTLTFGLFPKFLEMTGLAPDETVRIEKMRRENPAASVIGDLGGYMIPGVAASNAVAKTVPALAKNTFRSIVGREAVASAALEGGEQLTRGALRGDPFGEFDANLVGLSGLTGGVLGGGVAGLSRLLPTERLRAAGSSLTEADKAAASQFMDISNGMGVPVNVREAVNHTAGPRASRLEGAYNAAVSRPPGMAEAQSFDAARGPVIRDTGREMVTDLGGGIAPQRVTSAAEDVFTNIRQGADLDAQPHYQAAENRHLPPTWVPKHPYIDDARARIASGEGAEGRAFDMDKRYTSRTGRPGPTPPNSVTYIDEVRQEMQREIGREMAKPAPDNNYIAGIQRQLELLTERTDRVAPDYATARGLFETAMEKSDNLRGGPLRSLENQGGTAKGQASAIFDVSTGADAANSRAALQALGDANPDVPKGLLANHIDAAVSSDVVRPDAFGSSLFPNEHSIGLVDDILGPGGSPMVKQRLEAARAVQPFQGKNDAHLSGLNTKSISFDALLNFGSDNAVRAMQDPNFVKQLGRLGPTHAAAQAVQRSTNQALDLDELLALIGGMRMNALP